MNLVDNIIERVIEKSPILVRVATLLERLAIQVQGLCNDVTEITDRLAYHEAALQQLYAERNASIKHSTRVSLDVNVSESKEPEKPN